MAREVWRFNVARNHSEDGNFCGYNRGTSPNDGRKPMHLIFYDWEALGDVIILLDIAFQAWRFREDTQRYGTWLTVY